MENSSIASKHHYYVLFFKSPDFSMGKILKSLGVKKREIINFDTKFSKNSYFQLPINRLLGSRKLLDNKYHNLGEGFYKYDFYLGSFKSNRREVFYLCYPYKQIDIYLRKNYKKLFDNMTLFKPNVEVILNYFVNPSIHKQSRIEKEGLETDITKYTAHVHEGNTKNVSLTGENPLNSLVYKILSKEKDIVLKPVSMKLKCIDLDLGYIEILFDINGNYRFWISKNKQEERISMLPRIFEFFNEIDALYDSQSISDISKLEDDA